MLLYQYTAVTLTHHKQSRTSGNLSYCFCNVHCMFFWIPVSPLHARTVKTKTQGSTIYGYQSSLPLSDSGVSHGIHLPLGYGSWPLRIGRCFQT